MMHITDKKDGGNFLNGALAGYFIGAFFSFIFAIFEIANKIKL
jgi:hypothetical protein